MQQGRARNAPKFKNLIMNCHATQFGCITKEGSIPIVECPSQCIDKDTGARYGTDPTTGECLCPICSVRDCPRFYTQVAHQMYQANTMVAENGGQANVSVQRSSRHRPPPAVTGNYHVTA